MTFRMITVTCVLCLYLEISANALTPQTVLISTDPSEGTGESPLQDIEASFTPPMISNTHLMETHHLSSTRPRAEQMVTDSTIDVVQTAVTHSSSQRYSHQHQTKIYTSKISSLTNSQSRTDGDTEQPVTDSTISVDQTVWKHSLTHSYNVPINDYKYESKIYPSKISSISNSQSKTDKMQRTLVSSSNKGNQLNINRIKLQVKRYFKERYRSSDLQLETSIVNEDVPMNTQNEVLSSVFHKNGNQMKDTFHEPTIKHISQSMFSPEHVSKSVLPTKHVTKDAHSAKHVSKYVVSTQYFPESFLSNKHVSKSVLSSKHVSNSVLSLKHVSKSVVSMSDHASGFLTKSVSFSSREFVSQEIGMQTTLTSIQKQSEHSFDESGYTFFSSNKNKMFTDHPEIQNETPEMIYSSHPMMSRIVSYHANSLFDSEYEQTIHSFTLPQYSVLSTDSPSFVVSSTNSQTETSTAMPDQDLDTSKQISTMRRNKEESDDSSNIRRTDFSNNISQGKRLSSETFFSNKVFRDIRAHNVVQNDKESWLNLAKKTDPYSNKARTLFSDTNIRNKQLNSLVKESVNVVNRDSLLTTEVYNNPVYSGTEQNVQAENIAFESTSHANEIDDTSSVTTPSKLEVDDGTSPVGHGVEVHGITTATVAPGVKVKNETIRTESYGDEVDGVRIKTETRGINVDDVTTGTIEYDVDRTTARDNHVDDVRTGRINNGGEVGDVTTEGGIHGVEVDGTSSGTLSQDIEVDYVTTRTTERHVEVDDVTRTVNGSVEVDDGTTGILEHGVEVNGVTMGTSVHGVKVGDVTTTVGPGVQVDSIRSGTATHDYNVDDVTKGIAVPVYEVVDVTRTVERNIEVVDAKRTVGIVEVDDVTTEKVEHGVEIGEVTTRTSVHGVELTGVPITVERGVEVDAVTTGPATHGVDIDDVTTGTRGVKVDGSAIRSTAAYGVESDKTSGTVERAVEVDPFTRTVEHGVGVDDVTRTVEHSVGVDDVKRTVEHGVEINSALSGTVVNGVEVDDVTRPVERDVEVDNFTRTVGHGVDVDDVTRPVERDVEVDKFTRTIGHGFDVDDVTRTIERGVEINGTLSGTVVHSVDVDHVTRPVEGGAEIDGTSSGTVVNGVDVADTSTGTEERMVEVDNVRTRTVANGIEVNGVTIRRALYGEEAVENGVEAVDVTAETSSYGVTRPVVLGEVDEVTTETALHGIEADDITTERAPHGVAVGDIIRGTSAPGTEARDVSVEVVTTRTIEHDVAVDDVTTGTIENGVAVDDVTTGTAARDVNVDDVTTGTIEHEVAVDDVTPGKAARDVNVDDVTTGTIENGVAVNDVTTGTIENGVAVDDVTTGTAARDVNVDDVTTGTIENGVAVDDVTTGTAARDVNVDDVTTGTIKHDVAVDDVTPGTAARDVNIDDVTTGTIENGVAVDDVTTGTAPRDVNVVDVTTGTIEHDVAVDDVTTGTAARDVNVYDVTTGKIEGGVAVDDVTPGTAIRDVNTVNETTGTIEHDVAVDDVKTGTAARDVNVVDETTGTIEHDAAVDDVKPGTAAREVNVDDVTTGTAARDVNVVDVTTGPAAREVNVDDVTTGTAAREVNVDDVTTGTTAREVNIDGVITGKIEHGFAGYDVTPGTIKYGTKVDYLTKGTTAHGVDADYTSFGTTDKTTEVKYTSKTPHLALSDILEQHFQMENINFETVEPNVAEEATISGYTQHSGEVDVGSFGITSRSVEIHDTTTGTTGSEGDDVTTGTAVHAVEVGDTTSGTTGVEVDDVTTGTAVHAVEVGDTTSGKTGVEVDDVTTGTAVHAVEVGDTTSGKTGAEVDDVTTGTAVHPVEVGDTATGTTGAEVDDVTTGTAVHAVEAGDTASGTKAGVAKEDIPSAFTDKPFDWSTPTDTINHQTQKINKVSHPMPKFMFLKSVPPYEHYRIPVANNSPTTDSMLRSIENIKRVKEINRQVREYFNNMIRLLRNDTVYGTTQHNLKESSTAKRIGESVNKLGGIVSETLSPKLLIEQSSILEDKAFLSDNFLLSYPLDSSNSDYIETHNTVRFDSIHPEISERSNYDIRLSSGEFQLKSKSVDFSFVKEAEMSSETPSSVITDASLAATVQDVHLPSFLPSNGKLDGIGELDVTRVNHLNLGSMDYLDNTDYPVYQDNTDFIMANSVTSEIPQFRFPEDTKKNKTVEEDNLDASFVDITSRIPASMATPEIIPGYSSTLTNSPSSEHMDISRGMDLLNDLSDDYSLDKTTLSWEIHHVNDHDKIVVSGKMHGDYNTKEATRSTPRLTDESLNLISKDLNYIYKSSPLLPDVSLNPISKQSNDIYKTSPSLPDDSLNPIFKELDYFSSTSTTESEFSFPASMAITDSTRDVWTSSNKNIGISDKLEILQSTEILKQTSQPTTTPKKEPMWPFFPSLGITTDSLRRYWTLPKENVAVSDKLDINKESETRTQTSLPTTTNRRRDISDTLNYPIPGERVLTPIPKSTAISPKLDFDDFLLLFTFDSDGKDILSLDLRDQIKRGLEVSYRLGLQKRYRSHNARIRKRSSVNISVQLVDAIIKKGNVVEQHFQVEEDGRQVPADDASITFGKLSADELSLVTSVKVLQRVTSVKKTKMPFIHLSSVGMKTSKPSAKEAAKAKVVSTSSFLSTSMSKTFSLDTNLRHTDRIQETSKTLSTDVSLTRTNDIQSSSLEDDHSSAGFNTKGTDSNTYSRTSTHNLHLSVEPTVVLELSSEIPIELSSANPLNVPTSIQSSFVSKSSPISVAIPQSAVYVIHSKDLSAPSTVSLKSQPKAQTQSIKASRSDSSNFDDSDDVYKSHSKGTSASSVLNPADIFITSSSHTLSDEFLTAIHINEITIMNLNPQAILHSSHGSNNLDPRHSSDITVSFETTNIVPTSKHYHQTTLLNLNIPLTSVGDEIQSTDSSLTEKDDGVSISKYFGITDSEYVYSLSRADADLKDGISTLSDTTRLFSGSISDVQNTIVLVDNISPSKTLDTSILETQNVFINRLAAIHGLTSFKYFSKNGSRSLVIKPSIASSFTSSDTEQENSIHTQSDDQLLNVATMSSDKHESSLKYLENLLPTNTPVLLETPLYTTTSNTVITVIDDTASKVNSLRTNSLTGLSQINERHIRLQEGDELYFSSEISPASSVLDDVILYTSSDGYSAYSTKQLTNPFSNDWTSYSSTFVSTGFNVNMSEAVMSNQDWSFYSDIDQSQSLVNRRPSALDDIISITPTAYSVTPSPSIVNTLGESTIVDATIISTSPGEIVSSLDNTDNTFFHSQYIPDENPTINVLTSNTFFNSLYIPDAIPTINVLTSSDSTRFKTNFKTIETETTSVSSSDSPTHPDAVPTDENSQGITQASETSSYTTLQMLENKRPSYTTTQTSSADEQTQETTKTSSYTTLHMLGSKHPSYSTTGTLSDNSPRISSSKPPSYISQHMSTKGPSYSTQRISSNGPTTTKLMTPSTKRFGFIKPKTLSTNDDSYTSLKTSKSYITQRTRNSPSHTTLRTPSKSPSYTTLRTNKSPSYTTLRPPSKSPSYTTQRTSKSPSYTTQRTRKGPSYTTQRTRKGPSYTTQRTRKGPSYTTQRTSKSPSYTTQRIRKGPSYTTLRTPSKSSGYTTLRTSKRPSYTKLGTPSRRPTDTKLIIPPIQRPWYTTNKPSSTVFNTPLTRTSASTTLASTLFQGYPWLTTSTASPGKTPETKNDPPTAKELMQVILKVTQREDVKGTYFLRRLENGLATLYKQAAANSIADSTQSPPLAWNALGGSEFRVMIVNSTRLHDDRVLTVFVVYHSDEILHSDATLPVINSMSTSQISAVLGYPVLGPVRGFQTSEITTTNRTKEAGDVVLIVAVVVPTVCLLLVVAFLIIRLCRCRPRPNVVGILPSRYQVGETLDENNLAVDVEKGEIVDKTPINTPALHRAYPEKKLALTGGVFTFDSIDKKNLEYHMSEPMTQVIYSHQYSPVMSCTESDASSEQSHKDMVLKEKELLEKLGVIEEKPSKLESINRSPDFKNKSPKSRKKQRVVCKARNCPEPKYQTVDSSCELLSSSDTSATLTSIDSGDHTDASDEFTVIIPTSRTTKIKISGFSNDLSVSSSKGSLLTIGNVSPSAISSTRTTDTQTSRTSSSLSESSAEDGNCEKSIHNNIRKMSSCENSTITCNNTVRKFESDDQTSSCKSPQSKSVIRQEGKMNGKALSSDDPRHFEITTRLTSIIEIENKFKVVHPPPVKYRVIGPIHLDQLENKEEAELAAEAESESESVSEVESESEAEPVPRSKSKPKPMRLGRNMRAQEIPQKRKENIEAIKKNRELFENRCEAKKTVKTLLNNAMKKIEFGNDEQQLDAAVLQEMVEGEVKKLDLH